MKSALIDGRALQRIREFAGLTQEKLGAKVGADRTLVCHWEAGRAQPSAAKFKALCRVLKVKPDDLILTSSTEAA